MMHGQKSIKSYENFTMATDDMSTEQGAVAGDIRSD
jgi:hypothetical protein